jgi:hypothetical protein
VGRVAELGSLGRFTRKEQGTSIRVRVSIASALVVALALIYIRALASGYLYGTFTSIAHPWQDTITDILLFLFAAALFVCTLPLFRTATGWHRVAAALLLVLPVCVVAHFVIWLVRLYAHNAA